MIERRLKAAQADYEARYGQASQKRELIRSLGFQLSEPQGLWQWPVKAVNAIGRVRASAPLLCNDCCTSRQGHNNRPKTANSNRLIRFGNSRLAARKPEKSYRHFWHQNQGNPSSRGALPCSAPHRAFRARWVMWRSRPLPWSGPSPTARSQRFVNRLSERSTWIQTVSRGVGRKPIS